MRSTAGLRSRIDRAQGADVTESTGHRGGQHEARVVTLTFDDRPDLLPRGAIHRSLPRQDEAGDAIRIADERPRVVVGDMRDQVLLGPSTRFWPGTLGNETCRAAGPFTLARPRIERFCPVTVVQEFCTRTVRLSMSEYFAVVSRTQSML